MQGLSKDTTLLISSPDPISHQKSSIPWRKEEDGTRRKEVGRFRGNISRKSGKADKISLSDNSTLCLAVGNPKPQVQRFSPLRISGHWPMVDSDISSQDPSGWYASSDIIIKLIKLLLFFRSEATFGDPTFFRICLPKFLTVHYHLDLEGIFPLQRFVHNAWFCPATICPSVHRFISLSYKVLCPQLVLGDTKRHKAWPLSLRSLNGEKGDGSLGEGQSETSPGMTWGHSN